MNDNLSRLESALADRYAIERELGAGGMGDASSAYPTLDFPQPAGRFLQTAVRWGWHGGGLGE